MSILAMILVGAVVAGVLYMMIQFFLADGAGGPVRPERRGSRAPGRTGEAAAFLRGRVGGGFAGYDIQVQADADGSLVGRFGGPVLGKDLAVRFDGRLLSGRYGGAFEGKDIRASVSDGALSGRFGGEFGGADIELAAAGSRIHGRVGGQFVGFDVDLHYDPGAGTLSGRLGGPMVGNDVQAEVRGLEPLVAAALVSAVYYQRRVEARRNN